MREFVFLAVVFLAVYRLSRLVAVDRIFRAPREWLQWKFENRWIKRNGSAPGSEFNDSDEWQSAMAYLLGCMWCVSIWVSGLIIGVISLTTGLPVPWWLAWAAASGVTGWLASNEGE